MEYRDYFLTALATAEADTQSAEDLAKATEAKKTEILKNELVRFWELFNLIDENYIFGKNKKQLFSSKSYQQEKFLIPKNPILYEYMSALNLWFTARVKDDFRFEYFVQENDSTTSHIYFDDFETFVRHITMRVMEYKTKS